MKGRRIDYWAKKLKRKEGKKVVELKRERNGYREEEIEEKGDTFREQKRGAERGKKK